MRRVLFTCLLGALALGTAPAMGEDATQVGVRVFGAKVFSAKDKGACADTQNVVPVGIEVRARNIESSSDAIQAASVAGDQYAVLSMAGALGGDDTNFAAPVMISVDVTGTVTGKPTYADKVKGPGKKGRARRGKQRRTTVDPARHRGRGGRPAGRRLHLGRRGRASG